MSLGLDPLFSNLFYSLGLIPHFSRPAKRAEGISLAVGDPPLVSVLITLCREKKEDIAMTVSSLIRQTYPKHRLEVLMVVEPDDTLVERYATECLDELRGAGIDGKVIVSDGKLRIKPHALNVGMKQARGKYCAFYDASDEIDPQQIEKAVGLMEDKGYDVAQSAVFRRGRSILSSLLTIDTIFWYRKYIPLILRFAGGFPLSGEGLFVRRSALDEAGGFPEVLTEDAYLGIILAEAGRKFGLVDSVVVEKAPKNVRAHFTQRSRWQRGYLTCLRRLLKSKLCFARKFFLLLPFIAPISCTLAFLGWSAVLCAALASLIPGSASPQGLALPVHLSVAIEGLYYWSLALACVGIPLCIASYADALFAEKERGYLPFLAFIPLYWMFLGLVATCSLFRGTRHWGRTER